MSSAATERGLIFRSLDESGFPFILFLCVTGSLLAHVATFFLFQVVYPQRVTIPNPAPHVSLLLPNSPENIALLRWIEAEDPSLVASDNSVPPPTLAEVRYLPSFATSRTAPLGAPVEKTPAVRFPPAVERLTSGARVIPTGGDAMIAAAPTTWRFLGALTDRPLTKQAPLEFTHRTTTPISPSTLLIGVNAAGEIRYTFLQQSSGDADLDNLAATQLRRLNFTPAAADITWAHAIFDWGGDAYADENAKPE